jgi:flagella basal body P-ring formation protein FlgA
MLALCVAIIAVRADCVKVDGDRILARHLAGVLPELAGLPPDAVIGFSPKLGLARWLAPAFIERVAARYAISATVAEPVCVERLGERLDREQLRKALAAALQRAGHSNFDLTLTDYPTMPLPRGTLEFSLSGLSATSSTRPGGLWRGRLKVQGSQSVPLVVRVEVSVEAIELRAARDLAPGQIITAADLSQSTRRIMPGSAPVSVAPAAAIGKQTRRAIKSGGLVEPELLMAPPEIQRGDRVLVAVAAGRAAIGVEAMADTTARAGQSVMLTNPLSGKKFKATVTGRGRAAIHLETSTDETTTDPTTTAAGPARGARAGGNQEQETAAAVGTGPDHR